VRQCATKDKAELKTFEFSLVVTAEGKVTGGHAIPRSRTAICLLENLLPYGGEKMPPPPRGSYWVIVEINPLYSISSAR
jgi:hypothetical protein